MTTYSDLRTAFKDELNRSDCTDAIADRIITRGLELVDREVRHPEMITTATLSFTSGKATLPTDCLQVFAIYADLTPDRQLKFIPLDQYMRKSDPDDGQALYYTKVGREIWARPAPGSTTVTVVYYQSAKDSLTTDSSEFALLDRAHDLFLYACLFQAGTYFYDDRRGEWAEKFQALRESVNQSGAEAEMKGHLVAVQSPYPDLDY